MLTETPPAVAELSPERRAMLADKGRVLYGKYCKRGGRGICAESFACYHIGRGEQVVAADLLEYLATRPADEITLGLIERVRGHLAGA